MTQDIGETRDAILEENERIVQGILDANSHRKDPYWIVMFAKASKVKVKGKPTMTQVIKAYNKRPTPQVGMITGCVDNAKGSIEWDVNMPDMPIDYDSLLRAGAKETNTPIIETSSIPHAYVTQ